MLAEVKCRIPENDDMSTVDTNADEQYLNAVGSFHILSFDLPRHIQ